uniref:MITD1 C-terminal phospholipase D-like domain-containing protein n=1 Tax=Setaria digitata TaxID=48799 RepID=A0A915PJT6_9BILA
METHYLFQNCNASNERNRGGGLPFWRVFMNYRSDKPTVDAVGGETQSAASISDLKDGELISECTSEASCGSSGQAENDATKKRQPIGSFNLGAVFAEAEASDNLLERKQFNLKLVKEFRIEDGNTGFGYDTIFGDGIDERLKSVIVDEPYLRNKAQITNLVAFCELLVSRAPNLHEIVLCTQAEQIALHELWLQLGQLRIDLMLRNVVLKVKCSGTMHDREIRFDNGWTYRIGRGLDYFQKQQPFTLGITDYNLRRCQETNVCILREMRRKDAVEYFSDVRVAVAYMNHEVVHNKRRLVEHGAIHRDLMGTSGQISRLCAVRSGPNPFSEAVQRLQELDIEKREPVLLRCSALQRTRFVRMNTMQRSSEVFKVLYEFHTAVSQSMFRLVPSLETDECLVRHVFASVSGRSTRVLLRSSPIYTIHWHIISSAKQVQVKQRAVAQLSYELILQPMKIETAERWYMTWEYVVYRVSHGVHFAIMKSITDISSQERVLHIRVQHIYPKRFIRSVIAPVQVGRGRSRTGEEGHRTRSSGAARTQPQTQKLCCWLIPTRDSHTGQPSPKCNDLTSPWRSRLDDRETLPARTAANAERIVTFYSLKHCDWRRDARRRAGATKAQ